MKKAGWFKRQSECWWKPHAERAFAANGVGNLFLLSRTAIATSSLLDALSKRITVRGIDNLFPRHGFPINRSLTGWNFNEWPRARLPKKKIIFTRTQFSDGGRSVTPSTYTLRKIFSYVTSNVESVRRRIRFNEMFRRLILQPCEILFYENLRMIEIYSRNVVVSAIIPITITVLCFLVLRLGDYRYLLVLSH